MQGVPATLPAGTTANGNTFNIDGTWRQVTDTLSFSNSTNVNLFTQGYFQFNSGTPGDHIAFSFSLDGANAQHTIEVGVPPYFPSGINLFDQYLYEPGSYWVPPGNHTLTMWAVNRTANRTAQVQWRQVEFLALTGGSPDIMVDTWTKLLDIEFPATYASNPQNGGGEVAIELLGTSDSQPHQVDIGVEAVYDYNFGISQGTNCWYYLGNDYKNCLADFTIEALKIPGGRYQKFLFMHPLWWGMSQAPNRIRLFARKDPADTSNTSFTVTASQFIEPDTSRRRPWSLDFARDFTAR